MSTGALSPCPYCGPNTFHSGVCPKVLRIEYHENGGVKAVTLRYGAAFDQPSQPAGGSEREVS